MSEKRRSYTNAIRRDREPIRDLGRMTVEEYNAYIRAKNQDTFHKRQYHNADLRRLTNKEYNEQERGLVDFEKLAAVAR